MSSSPSEFQQLGQALQSGKMGAAQQDFAQLTQNISNAQSGNNSAAAPWSSAVFSNLAQSLKLQSATGTSGTSGASGSGSQSQDLDALGEALDAGNLSSAQQAYSQLRTHHHGVAQAAQTGTSDPNSASTSNTTGGGANFLSTALSMFSAVA
jgi:hypothetical protein